jgi:hypothetical protein
MNDAATASVGKWPSRRPDEDLASAVTGSARLARFVRGRCQPGSFSKCPCPDEFGQVRCGGLQRHGGPLLSHDCLSRISRSE